MDIVKILKDGVEVSKKNYIIFVPATAVMLIMFVLTLVFVGGSMLSMGITPGGMSSPTGMMSSFGALMGGMFIVSIVGLVLGLVAHGMTVGMAREAIETGSTYLNSGISIATSRFVSLLTAAILVGIVVGIGTMLLLIPGLIAAFFLMFTFVLIIIENISAVEAMKKSFDMVKNRLSDSVIFFVAIFVVGAVFAVANMILNIVPIIGQLAGAVLMGVLSGYISVLLVMVYKDFKATAK